MSTPANDLNITQPGYIVFDGTATFTGRTFQAGTGITLTNPSGIAGNTTISSTGSLTDLHAPRFIVSNTDLSHGANYSSIAAAINAAVLLGGNQTIFIQPGTYTENLTLVSGINLTAFGSDSSLNNTGIVIINGNATLSTAGTVTISGIQLQTNSAAFLTVSGSAASIVNLNNCYLNCLNNTGITYSSSSASSGININNCTGNIGTTGIALYTQSSAGIMYINYTYVTNSGGSTTASSNSKGSITINYSYFLSPFSTSSTGVLNYNYSFCDTSAQNATSITTAGTGQNNFFNSRASSGTASSLSIGAGTVLAASFSNVASTNTNAITGAGTINYQNISFSLSSKTINVTTQTIAGTIYGSTTTAPTAGFLGEQITSGFVGPTSLSNSIIAALTSITLTPGVWDISAITYFIDNSNFVAFQLGIGTTSASFTGVNFGDNGYQLNATMQVGTGSIPAYRQVITTSTTYYLNVLGSFSAGTTTASGRISAVRVG